MSLVYNGLEVPLLESIIEVHNRNPYIITFNGSFRPQVMIPFLVDALRYQKVKPHNINGVRIKSGKVKIVKIEVLVGELITMEVVETSNKIITDKPLLDHLSWNSCNTFNDAAQVYNTIIKDQDGLKIKTKGLTISFTKLAQSMITFNEPQSTDISKIIMHLHSPTGIPTAIMSFGVTPFTDTEFNIHTIEQITLNMIGEPMGLSYGIKVIK